MATTLTGDANAGWSTAIGGNPDDGSLPKAAHIRTPVQAVLNDLARIGDRLGYNAGTANVGTDSDTPSAWASWFSTTNNTITSTGLEKQVTLATNQLVHVTAEFEASCTGGDYAVCRLYVNDGGGYAVIGTGCRVVDFVRQMSISYWYEAGTSGLHTFALRTLVDAGTGGTVTFLGPARLHVQLFGKRFPNDGVAL